MAEPVATRRTLDLIVAKRRVPTPCEVIGQGTGKGEQALLLPALSSISSREEMVPLARALADAYTSLVPDWPGFGAHDRVRVPLEPATCHAFLDALLAAAPGPYALGIAAGHAATYLAGAARRHPAAFGRLVLVAPTWRGPLPTAMGPERAHWFGRIRRAVEAPVLGEALYRVNISPPVIGKMMRAHVYADAAHVTPAVVRAKHRITRQRNGRFGTAAFVTGGLDPVLSREEFHDAFREGLPPVQVLRPEGVPRRSGAEMDALIATGRVSGLAVPGALSPHEEYPAEVARAVRAA